MKTALTFVALLLAAAVAYADLDAAWTASTTKDGQLHINFSHRPTSQWGEALRLDELTGLTSAQIASKTQVPVQFTLRRDAGSFAFDGTFRNGFGAGQLTFTPNRAFAATLRSEGMTFDRDEDEALLRLAIVDVSNAFIREARQLFPGLTLDQIKKLRAVGVTADWVRDMRAAGVTIEGAQDAKKLAALGVTPQYVRMLADNGYKNLTVRQLTKLAAAGVDAEYIREMSRYRER